MRRMKGIGKVVLAAMIGSAGCGDATMGSESSDSPKGTSGSPSMGGSKAVLTNTNTSTGTLPGAVAVDAAVPKEIEQTVDFLAPKAGGRFVFAANPLRDSVAVIDSLTQSVTEVTPGDAPTYLATVPGKDVALVLNVGDGTAAILRASPAGTTVSDPLSVVKNANSIDIAPDGLHAVVWFNLARATGQSLSGSIQEVTLLDLSVAPEKAYTLTVGYKPSGVVFSEDGKAGFVINRDGISKIVFADISTDTLTPLVRIGQSTPPPSDAGIHHAPQDDAGTDALPPVDAGIVDGGLSPDSRNATDTRVGNPVDSSRPPVDTAPDTSPDTEGPVVAGDPIDVSVTRDGRYAIARREGSSEILLVDLQSKVIRSRVLTSPLTDLDLWESGTSVYAFAVLRAESTLVKVAIPDGFSAAAPMETWPFPNDFVGQVVVGDQGKRAVLFSTAVPTKQIVSVDLGVGATRWQSVRLEKAIRAVALSPDERTAFVVHTKKTGSPADKGITSEEQVERSYGYSAIALDREDAPSKLMLTAAMPEPFVITPDSTQAFVLVRDDAAGVRLAQKISLDSFRFTDFPLGSPPASIGTLSIASRKVFISQVHTEGRISFVDWQTNAVETITGFALNGRIRQ